jgi:hypothetical protein
VGTMARYAPPSSAGALRVFSLGVAMRERRSAACVSGGWSTGAGIRRGLATAPGRAVGATAAVTGYSLTSNHASAEDGPC